MPGGIAKGRDWRKMLVGRAWGGRNIGYRKGIQRRGGGKGPRGVLSLCMAVVALPCILASLQYYTGTEHVGLFTSNQARGGPPPFTYDTHLWPAESRSWKVDVCEKKKDWG